MYIVIRYDSSRESRAFFITGEVNIQSVRHAKSPSLGGGVRWGWVGWGGEQLLLASCNNEEAARTTRGCRLLSVFDYYNYYNYLDVMSCLSCVGLKPLAADKQKLASLPEGIT